MAPMTTPRSRSRLELDSDDEDTLIDRASNSSKRARLSHDGDRSHSTNGTPLTNDYDSQANDLQMETLRSAPARNKHQPGSIVRVKLNNFVTYTAVEFLPGPNLNMVIGPNGTGKSTLVCAICIGLGWDPKFLGRAKEVSEFVKHGAKEAIVEIELAKDRKRFKSNIIIRCIIKREANKAFYSVNGEQKSKKAAMELARSLSIQIDNLCQFLPQEKVVEFAAMNPIELLKSTQRAVAPQEMIDKHEELKERKKGQKSMQMRIEEDQNNLDNLESRQRLQEADVVRIREREELVKKVEYLEAARPFADYRAARDAHNEIKERKKEAEQELSQLRREVEPSLAAVNEKKQYRNEIGIATKARKHVVEKAQEKSDRIDRAFQALHDQSADLDAERDAEKKGHLKHKNDISRVNGVIDRLKRQMVNPPGEVDTAAYNEKTREKQRAMESCETDIRDAQNKQRELTHRGIERKEHIAQAEQDLGQLDSQAGKQNHKLQSISADTYKAWQWLQEHQDQFEKRIFGPPIVECSVKDPRYVDHIESLFQKGLLLSFTVQTKNDFAKLSGICSERLRLSEVNIKTIEFGLGRFRSPASAEEMKRFGFESWALDHMQGPEAVLAMLCSEIKLHETGVSIQDTTSQQFDMLQRSEIGSWVSSKSSYRITRRREYGPSATSTRVGEVRKAAIWTEQPVDLTAKRELQESIDGWKEELNAFTNEVKELQVRVKQGRDKIRQFQIEIKALTEEKSAKQSALAAFKGLPTKLSQEEKKREASQEFMNGIRGRLSDIQRRQEEIAMERANFALTYVDVVEKLRIDHNALHVAELMLIESSSDFEVLTERNRSVTDLLKVKEQEMEELLRETSIVRERGKELLAVCKTFLNSEDADLTAFLRALPEGQSRDELEADIESEKARLELMHEGNGGVIREFERRQKQIDSVTSKLNDIKTAKAEVDALIERVQSEWEPKLDDLVQKISNSFSYNMEHISCAGEVGITKAEDFDQWAIQIRVKFRESEPLTPLDSHRQSGGERAVSTVFYLMSLQSLTRSPFRVVDEINQGMDPRNERLVHKRMVGIACGTTSSGPNDSGYASGERDRDDEEDGVGNENPDATTSGSQYFLITPKLLHDLEYARGMQVLCIASGEYMPADQSKVDFKACVDLMRGLKAEGTLGGAGAERLGLAAG